VATPPPEPQVRIALWVKLNKLNKVVALTDLMDIDEVFEILQEKFDRACEGKEIKTLLIDLGDEDGVFGIEKGDTNDGWQQLLDIAKAENKSKMRGEAETG
jgi:hypothetical protein